MLIKSDTVVYIHTYQRAAIGSYLYLHMTVIE